MRVADMYLSLDMKLHEDAYGEETGTGDLARRSTRQRPGSDPTSA